MSQSGFSTYWRDYSLFEDEDDLALVVEDVPEVHDLAGVVADGEHGDLVQDVHGAVAQRAVGPGPDRASRPLSGKIPGIVRLLTSCETRTWRRTPGPSPCACTCAPSRRGR